MQNFKLPLTIDHRGMSVPYMRKGDPASHDFVDLKAHPEQIDLLPELQDWPELKQAIRTINADKGLRTLGCANWSSNEIDQNNQTFVSSYIQLCFVKPDMRDHVEPYLSFYYVLGVRLFDATLPDNLRIEAQLRKTGFNGGKLAVGWSFDYNVWGHGVSHDEARKVCNVAYEHLLACINSEFVQPWFE